MVKKPSEAEEDRGLRMPLGPSVENRTEPDSALRTFVVAEFPDESSHRLPSMPPSYEEVIKNSGAPVRVSRYDHS
jgi:hypothetical protein